MFITSVGEKEEWLKVQGTFRGKGKCLVHYFDVKEACQGINIKYDNFS